MVSFIRRVKRTLHRLRNTDKLSVWTRGNRGECYHYDLRICPARNRTGSRREFLVRFDRTGPQGNPHREYRRMDLLQVTRLRHASA